MLIKRKTLRKPSHRYNKKNLILVGIRQALGDVIVIAEKNNYKIVGILDKYYYGNEKFFKNIPIIGNEDWLLDKNNKLAQSWIYNCKFFLSSWWDGRQHTPYTIGLNNEQVRKDRIDILDQASAEVINLISPLAHIRKSDSIKLGKGILIGSSTLISDNVTIEDYSVIDHNVIVTHSKVGKNCIIGVGSCISNADINDNVRVGVNCTIISTKKNFQNLNIGTNSIIHLTSVVTDDVPDGYIYTRHEKMLRRIGYR